MRLPFQSFVEKVKCWDRAEQDEERLLEWTRTNHRALPDSCQQRLLP